MNPRKKQDDDNEFPSAHRSNSYSTSYFHHFQKLRQGRIVGRVASSYNNHRHPLLCTCPFIITMAGTTKLSLLLSAASVVYVDSLYNPFKRTRQKLSHPIFFASNSEIVGDAAQSTITNGHYRKYHSVEFRAEFLHRVLSRRGGESVDENDIAADEGEIPMSHFISSFESELAEIRREVELEAREEMQKLRGMLEWSENKYHGEEVAEEEDMMEAYEDRKNENGLHEQRFVGEEDELVDEVRSDDSGVFNDGVKISEEELQVNDEEYGKEEKEQKEEIDRESSDLENYAENTEYPRKENRTKEIEEIAGGEGGSEIIELDNINETVSYLPEEQEEEISAVIEEVTEQVDNEIIPTRSTILEEGITEIEDEIEREQPIDAANKTITAADPKPKLRKKAKSSKKGKVGKMTNQEEDTVPTTKNPKAKMRKAKAKENMSEKVIDFESIHAFDEFSSKPAIHKMGTQQSVEVTFTPEDEELERSRSRGVTRLMRSELARALTLFIATIVVSIWMQRLQRQLEAQGN